MTAPTLPTSTLVRPFKEAPASRAARAIIPQPASPGRPSTTTGPRPRPATAPHPGFPRGCDHPPGVTRLTKNIRSTAYHV